MRLIDIFNRLTTQGGVTLSLDSTEYTGTQGFVVGVHSIYVVLGDTLAALATELTHAHTVGLHLHPTAEFVVGAWKCPDGRFSVDINAIVHDLDEARALAVRTQQKAIYDLASGEVIDIPEVAEPGPGVPIPQIAAVVGGDDAHGTLGATLREGYVS